MLIFNSSLSTTTSCVLNLFIALLSFTILFSSPKGWRFFIQLSSKIRKNCMLLDKHGSVGWIMPSTKDGVGWGVGRGSKGIKLGMRYIAFV